VHRSVLQKKEGRIASAALRPALKSLHHRNGDANARIQLPAQTTLEIRFHGRPTASVIFPRPPAPASSAPQSYALDHCRVIRNRSQRRRNCTPAPAHVLLNSCVSEIISASSPRPVISMQKLQAAAFVHRVGKCQGKVLVSVSTVSVLRVVIGARS